MSNAERIIEIDSPEHSVDTDTTSTLHETTAYGNDPTPDGIRGRTDIVGAELAEAQAQTAVQELPAKFKDKSTEEIVEAYTNLEKELGRKGQEIGELRAVTDAILRNQPQAPEQDAPQEPEETDFFDDPAKAVRNILAAELAPLRQQNAVAGQEQFFSKLQTTHPEYEQIISSKEFANWIEASPYRTKMYLEADSYNYDAANELLTSYGSVTEQAKPKLDLPELDQPVQLTAEQKAKRATDLQAAGVVHGSTGETTRKVYRRSDLVRLLRDDPERYYDLQPEIMKAYKEKRVR